MTLLYWKTTSSQVGVNFFVVSGQLLDRYGSESACLQGKVAATSNARYFSNHINKHIVLHTLTPLWVLSHFFFHFHNIVLCDLL